MYRAGWALGGGSSEVGQRVSSETLVLMSEDDPRLTGQAWSHLDPDTEWWPALPRRVGGATDDDGVHDHDLTHTVPGGMDRVRSTRPLLNAQRVPPGVHHDVDQPIPVTVTLRWETGDEELDTLAVEWQGAEVRIRIADLRVMTGAVWLPVEDVRRG